MAEEQSPELKLVEQAPTEILLERVKQKLTERKIEQEKSLVAEKIRIGKERQLARQEKQLARQEEQRQSLRDFKERFRSLLDELSGDYLNINLAEVSKNELMILPDLVAVKARPLAILQGIGGVTASLAVLKGVALLAVVFGSIADALFVLIFGGILLTFFGFLVTASVCMMAGIPSSVFEQKMEAIGSYFRFRSLRYIYRYYRTKKKLGPEEYIKYIQNMKR